MQTVRRRKAVGHLAGEFFWRGVALQSFRRARASKIGELARLPLSKERAKRSKIVAERVLAIGAAGPVSGIWGLSREAPPLIGQGKP